MSSNDTEKRQRLGVILKKSTVNTESSTAFSAEARNVIFIEFEQLIALITEVVTTVFEHLHLDVPGMI